LNGSYKFLSLETGDIIALRKWTKLPVPNDVIMRLEEMTNDPHDDIMKVLKDQELDETNDVTDDEETRKI
jgi:hypothetical protein